MPIFQNDEWQRQMYTEEQRRAYEMQIEAMLRGPAVGQITGDPPLLNQISREDWINPVRNRSEQRRGIRPLVFQKRKWTEIIPTMEDPFGRYVQCKIQIRVLGLPPGVDDQFEEYATVTDPFEEAQALRTLDEWAEQIKQRIKEQYESRQDNTDSGLYRHGQDDITS